MSDFHHSPRALRRFNLAEVPALFSEGSEPDAPSQNRLWWPEPVRLRLRIEWAALFGRCLDYPRQFWLKSLGA